MNNYWENNLFPQFLQTKDSCTLSSLSNIEIQYELNNLALRAIADFKFPKISLLYDYDETINPETEVAYGYYFLEIITQKEINVILARMKQYWIEYQVSQERMFQNLQYDRDIRAFSPGNTLDKLIKMYTTFKEMADRVEYDYGRVAENGEPTWGTINE